MPWIGTTCMIKMIELHCQVRVALSRCYVDYDVDYDVDHDAMCLWRCFMKLNSKMLNVHCYDMFDYVFDC